jgi:hypothetical protein
LVTVEKEKDIEWLVDSAIDKLKVVKDYSEKENRQIVSELAKDLEAIISMDNICTEIINRLDGHLKPRTIREYLDVKYKIKTRVQNARKQKKNKQSGLAAKPPLNKVSETLVIDGRNEISFRDVDNPQSFQPKETSVVDSIDIRSLSQKESVSSTEQKQQSKGQVNTEIAECPGCIGKEERIKELEEALQKVPQFIAADKIGPSTAAIKGLKEAPEEPLEFEVSKMGSEIRDFFISNNIKSTKDTIWFSGKIDRTTGKIIYFDLGRLDPQRDIDDS